MTDKAYRDTSGNCESEAMMRSSRRCPISGERVDESVGQVYGIGVFLVLVLAMAMYWPWLLLPLMVDFAIRLIVGLSASPGVWLAKWVASVLRLRKRPHDAAPKRFAAGLGLIFTISAMFAALIFASPMAFYALAGMFAVCAALEGFLGICVGCRVYGLLPSRLIEPRPEKEMTTDGGL